MPAGELRLAVFDCDGTLVDSQNAIVAAMGYACERCGVPVPAAEAVRRVVGLPLREAIARVTPDSDGAEHDRLTEHFRVAFTDIRRSGADFEPLYPGAREAIEALAGAGFLLGIATGKSRRGLVATLERHGLSGSFVTLKTVDDGPGKPRPDILLAAMAESGVRPDRTVMIGDTSYDMLMARAAGARALGVAWGYHAPAELLASGAERVAERYDQVGSLVADLLGNGR
jgi:phosphoglycolate phosphatase